MAGVGVAAGDELEDGVGPALCAGADLIGFAVAPAVGPPQSIGAVVDGLLDQVEADRVEISANPAHAGVAVHEHRSGAGPVLALQPRLAPIGRLAGREPSGLPGERVRGGLTGPVQQARVAVNGVGPALLGRVGQSRRMVHGDVTGGQPLSRVGHGGKLLGHPGDPASLAARHPNAVLQHLSRRLPSPVLGDGGRHLAQQRVGLVLDPTQHSRQRPQLRPRQPRHRHLVQPGQGRVGLSRI